jgi:hypothetical protein
MLYTNLVGQEALGDVAVGKLGRAHERSVADGHAVVRLVARLEAAQDGNGGRHAWLAHIHLPTKRKEEEKILTS